MPIRYPSFTCLFANTPVNLSPALVNATTDGVVREPSAFSITLGFLPSIMDTHELVVPRSIPITAPFTSELGGKHKKNWKHAPFDLSFVAFYRLYSNDFPCDSYILPPVFTSSHGNMLKSPDPNSVVPLSCACTLKTHSFQFNAYDKFIYNFDE